MKREIEYWYNVVDQGCGCCHMGFSEYSMWEDGILVTDDCSIEVCENEADLRKYLAHLEPFNVSPNSRWF